MFFSTKEFCNINRPFWCLCCLLHRRWCSCWRETPRRTWCPCILWDRAWSGPASIDLERGALRRAGNLGLDCVSHLELQLAVLLVKGEHAKVIVAGEVRKPPGRRFNGNYMCHQNPKSCLPTFWSVWGHSCCQGTEPPPKQSRCRNQVDLKNKSKTMCSDQDWTYQKTFPKVIVMTHHSLSALPVYQSHLLLLSSQSLPCWSWTKTFIHQQWWRSRWVDSKMLMTWQQPHYGKPETFLFFRGDVVLELVLTDVIELKPVLSEEVKLCLD